MAAWRQLERSTSQPPLELIAQSNRATIHAITEAQRAGKISDRFAPADLLALVLTIAAIWPALTPELTAEGGPHTQAHRRQVITDAVSALITT